MAEQPELKVEPRTLLGKQVKQLRRQGILPANIYGHNVESTAVQVPALDFVRLAKQVGRTSLINLKVQGERRARPVVIREVSRKPGTGDLLHVNFLQVSLKEKMHVDVPLHLVGHSRAVADFNGVLEQFVTALSVECLPTDIPNQIEVDISSLDELGDAIHAKDLTLPENVTLLADPDTLVAHVSAPRIAEEIAAEEAAAEAAEAAAEAGVPPEEAPATAEAEQAEEEEQGGE